MRISGQVVDTVPVYDTIIHAKDTIPIDSIRFDSIRLDSARFDSTRLDSIVLKHRKKKESAVDAKVEYKAVDTMIFDLSNKKIFLYNEAQVIYKDIQLDAGYIEFDMANDEVYAEGLPDSSGVLKGKPAFKDGEQTFDSYNLRYNFNTQRGLIKKAISPQEGGFLHADITKKHDDGTIHVKDGKYTTCDLEHPHYYIAMTKAKVIPDDKIVSGRAYMVLEDVPLPFLTIPFGFFPNTKKSSAGILIPSYGEETMRGFYLRNGGWYMPVNDYMDFMITADVYSKGSWGTKVNTRYVKRYKFSGNWNASYFKNVYGDRGLPDYQEVNDYQLRWSHGQSDKANPTSNFSANVNVSSTSYDRNNSYSTQDYLTNTKNSSIAYSKQWPGTPFLMDATANYTQHSQTQAVNMKLPSASFRVNRIFPFKRKKAVGKRRWYEDIQLSYSSQFENQIYTYDSVLFTSYTREHMKNGYTHSIPLSKNFKVLKFCNISPSISYKGVIYGSHIEKHYDSLYINPETGRRGRVDYDTIREGLEYAHALTPSISFGVDPTVYGMFQVKNPDSKIVAVRHMMKPSARFSYTPDMNKVGLIPKDKYYHQLNYIDVESGDTINTEYSIYENYIYRTPLAPGRSGSVSLNLRNNVEMKVRTPKDTVNDTKKIKLIETLDFSTSYNPFAKENTPKWSNLNMVASNTFFNGKLNIRFRSTFDHYKHDSAYNKIPDAPWQGWRMTNASLTFGTSFRSQAGKKTPPPAEGEEEMIEEPLGEEDVYNDYVDFSVPWNFRFDYSFNYSKPKGKESKRVSQTVNFSGDISLTPKWKFGFRSGYDIEAKDFTYTSFNIHRDLHCWEMRFSVVPFGYRQNYNFMINIVTPILRDLKYEKKQSWHDRPEY